jgi:O-antigen ligase
LQEVGVLHRPTSFQWTPFLALLVLAGIVVAASAIFGPLFVLPIFGLLFMVLVFARPEYGIALLLSTFLMTYTVMQGSGLLTLNNVLGGIFTIILTYRLYQEGDWWFVRRPEIQLLAFIALMFYVSDRLNAPDPRYFLLLGPLPELAENLRTFVNRVAFTVFFINFIRTPGHVRMIYVLALGLMVYTSLAGEQAVLAGGGVRGYRAGVAIERMQAGIIVSAANPNRLAMFAILAAVGLWYLAQSWRKTAVTVVTLPVIGVLALAVFMAASRSGLLGLVVGAVAIALDEGIDLRKLFMIVIAGLFVMVLVVQFVPQKNIDRITNFSAESGEGSSSLQRRSYTWKIALDLFQENPFLGVGMGNWGVVRFVKDPARTSASPHSSYLLALVEGGSFCLAGFLALLWCTWRNFRFAESYVTDPEFPLAHLAWIVKALKISLLVLVFFSLVADLWQLVILFWLVGLSIVIRRLVEQTLVQAPAY